MVIKRIPPKVNNKKRKLRVCAYARVSTDSLEQEDSLVNQTNRYRQMIDSTPDWEFAGIYSDQGTSGFKGSRKGFQQMLADAREGRFDMVLVKSISRFARNTYDLLEVTRELTRLRIAVYFELQGINTLTTAGELMLTVKGAFAQAESDSASEGAKMHYRHQFQCLTRTAATDRTYGFCSGPNDALGINEDEACVVRLVFDLADKGVWPSKIKEYLNQRNIPAPAGGKWDDTGIARVLRNVLYRGDLILQKTYKDHNRISRPNHGQADQWYIKEDHRAIVAPAQWDRVQKVLDERRKHLDTPLPDPPVEHRSSHMRYPLTNLLYCPFCGAKLLHKWGNRRREYWACKTNLKVSAAACKGVWLPASVTTSWVGISEPVTVIPYKDEYGMQHYTALPKDEYEAFSDCPYRKDA